MGKLKEKMKYEAYMERINVENTTIRKKKEKQIEVNIENPTVILEEFVKLGEENERALFITDEDTIESVTFAMNKLFPLNAAGE